jgi:predicted secreted protein
MNSRILLITLLLLGLNQPLIAGDPVKISTETRSVKGQLEISLIFTMEKGWHIQSNQPLDAYLIPTAVDVTTCPALQVTQTHYPQPVLREAQFGPSRVKVSLFEDKSRITIEATLPVRPATGNEPACRFQVTYQACTEKQCSMPKTQAVDIATMPLAK